MLVFATGQIGGVKEALVRGMTDSLVGHIQVKPREAPRDFFDVQTGRRISLIPADQLASVLAKIRTLPEVAAAAPRLRFGALVGNDEKSTPAMVMAIDPMDESRVSPDMAASLSLVSSGIQASLVSKHLVDKLSIPVGQELFVVTETPIEAYNGRPFDIKGYASSPVLIDEYMNMLVIANLDRCRKMLYVEDVATDIGVRVKPAYVGRLDDVIAHIETVLSPQERQYLGAYSYREVAQSVNSVGTIASSMAAIQVGVVMFVMLVIVLILTKMGLRERRQEIGSLIALGMTRGRLVRLFSYEVVIRVLIGYGIGFAIAAILLLSIRHSGGIAASSLVEQFMNGGKIMIPVLDGATIFFGLLVVLGVSLLTTFASCWRAASEDAVDLLNSTE